jgi:manganese transport system substrate-binding protein
MRTRGRIAAALSALVAGVMMLAGCSGAAGPAHSADDHKPVVLTTFTVLQDVAQNVAGDHLTVESITKPGAEIHEYEPTPGDIAKASKADLILDNGLGLERWFNRFMDQVHVKHVVVSDGVTPIDITEDEFAGKPNPHAWMSPKNVQIYVDNMVKAFSDLDPDHAADYRKNGDAYKKKLQGIQDDLTSELSKLPKNQRALVSCEGAFSYLTRDAGLTEKYLWPVNAGQEGTPQQISGVIDFVKANKVPAVFCESTVSLKPMNQVVNATGAKFGGTLYVDSLSEKNGPVPTYLDLLRHDADTISAGLTGKTS